MRNLQRPPPSQQEPWIHSGEQVLLDLLQTGRRTKAAAADKGWEQRAAAAQWDLLYNPAATTTDHASVPALITPRPNAIVPQSSSIGSGSAAQPPVSLQAAAELRFPGSHRSDSALRVSAFPARIAGSDPPPPDCSEITPPAASASRGRRVRSKSAHYSMKFGGSSGRQSWPIRAAGKVVIMFCSDRSGHRCSATGSVPTASRRFWYWTRDAELRSPVS